MKAQLGAATLTLAFLLRPVGNEDRDWWRSAVDSDRVELERANNANHYRQQERRVFEFPCRAYVATTMSPSGHGSTSVK